MAGVTQPTVEHTADGTPGASPSSPEDLKASQEFDPAEPTVAEPRRRRRSKSDSEEIVEEQSKFRVFEPGVTTQRPYKTLDEIPWELFADRLGDFTVEDDLITFEREDRQSALNAAANLITMVPGEWEQVSSYETGIEENPQWRVVLRRKE